MKAMARLRVGVVYGGRSSEHEVSLASAASVFAHLDPHRYVAVPIFVQQDGRWSIADHPPTMLEASAVIADSRTRSDTLPPVPVREVHPMARPGGNPLFAVERLPEETALPTSATIERIGVDVVFPVMHGPYGEDGTLQGLLELANVPYVGAGVLASAVAMDKTVAKLVFASRGLPVVDYTEIRDHEWDGDPSSVLNRIQSDLQFPLFVKPANLGSSVGISKANDRAALERAIDLARHFDRKVLVERAVNDPRELECGVLGNDSPIASVPGEIVPSGDFYDYEAKYVNDSSQIVIPADVPADLAERIQQLAVEAFRALDAAGMARVDFLLEGTTERLFVNEVNTIPGFTTISMYAKMWEASGLTYPALIDRLIELALERHSRKQALQTSAT